MLYTLESEPSENSLYYIFNNTLGTENRTALEPWFLYLRLIMNGLEKLPSISTTVYRGVRCDLKAQYPTGLEFVWWAFSSCTTKIEVLENPQFLPKTTACTMFHIFTTTGKDIKNHSMCSTEDEVLLLLFTTFLVKDRAQLSDKLVVIQLEEIESPILGIQASKDSIILPPSTIMSPLYEACRENKITLVRYYLETMSLKEVDAIQPNGSTALHVAAYLGHLDVVQLLLRKGCSCSIINKYGNTPSQEAKSNEIKVLIARRINSNRFISSALEWIVATGDADYQAHQLWKNFGKFRFKEELAKMIAYIEDNYLEKSLKSIQGYDKIKLYFNDAIKKNNPENLLVAYTADTGFFSTVNHHLAELKIEDLMNGENLSRAYYIGIIACHPQFAKLSYKGFTFRGLVIGDDDLKLYKVGTKILTKTFSSTSKLPEVAMSFLRNHLRESEGLNTICMYEIRNPRTALSVEHLSVFRDEEEVLVMPYSAFKIVDIRILPDNYPKVEIKLKECEPW